MELVFLQLVKKLTKIDDFTTMNNLASKIEIGSNGLVNLPLVMELSEC